MKPTKVEYLTATNVAQTTMLRFRRLTSPTLCRKIIQERAPGLPNDVLERKAEGVAFAVRSAIGFWETATPTLSAKALTRYYALLQASIAEQVASPEPSADLAAVQKHTEQGGHGLTAVQAPEGDFPDNYYVFVRTAGHFAQYARSRGVDFSPYAIESLPKKWEKIKEVDQRKGLSLSELLLRVPEMPTIAEECLGQPALAFHVGLSDRSVEEVSRSFTAKFFGSKTVDASPEPSNGTRISYVDLYTSNKLVTAEWLAATALPFSSYEPGFDEHSQTSFWTGALHHPPTGKNYLDHLEHYKSDYCGTSVIAPFWGCTDLFTLHLATLYALSIVVRYLPSLWHRVEHGNLDHVRVLIDHYLSILDHIGPALALERITGIQLQVSVPGTLTSPM
jgi:hypothetical protein